jgi:hypothetical protein
VVLRGRVSATLWLVIGLGIVALLIGGEWMMRTLRPASDTAVAAKPPDPAMIPDFQVGDAAPDFTLPDSKEVPHRLSDLVKSDTLLCFTCGCSSCLDVQTYLGILMKRLGAKAPQVISVTNMPKEREASYFRDTKLKQTLLYEQKGGPIMKQYRGHPCPRIYALLPDRTISHIGMSPKDAVSVSDLGFEMAAMLGVPREGPGGAPPPLSGP